MTAIRQLRGEGVRSSVGPGVDDVRDILADLGPLAFPDGCDVIGDGACDVLDAVALLVDSRE